MSEKFIGPADNTSGSYFKNDFCKELSVRRGGYMNAKRLYRFNSRFGQEYNLTDPTVLDVIDSLIEEQDIDGLYDYLYGLLIKEFGVINFLADIDEKIEMQKKESYRMGRQTLQSDMRCMLGL